MPRRNHRREDDLSLDEERARRGVERLVTSSDGQWSVRHITTTGAVKTYRCPGCDHEIRKGVSHLVVVPHDDVGERRHWHTECWRRELRLHR